MTGANVTTVTVTAIETNTTPSGYGDVLLTAQWTPGIYTVTYDDNGATTAHVGGDDTYAAGSAFSLPTPPVKDGFTFIGWRMTGSHVTAATVATHATTASPTGYGNITLTARWTSVVYTVTFDSQGGSSASPIDFGFGDPVDLPVAPTRRGYSFDGWFLDATGGSALGSSYTAPTAANLTIYAQWTAVPYSVTYDDNGATTAHSGGDSTYVIDTSFTLPTAPSKTGYTFTGWTLAGTHVTDATLGAGAQSATPSGYGDVHLTAHWTPNTYNVTYETQGGSTVDAATWDFGTTIDLPAAPTRDGYIFNGWFLGSTGGSALGATHTPTTAADLIIYAQWTAIQYTVTYDTQGGSDVAPSSFSIDDTITLPDAPTKDGYAFTGWFLASSGGSSLGTTHTPGAAGDITIYAHWAANSYTVTYNSHGGSSKPSASFDFGTAITLPSAPTRAGYDFTGWFLGASGGSALDTTYTPTTAADLTIHAHWTPKSYTVSYDSRGGSSVDSATFDFGNTIDLPAAPSKDGYTFTGWYVAPSGGSALGSSMTPSTPGDFTLYAHWTANPYTVSYDAQGGSTVASANFGLGDVITLPSEPNWAGHTFAGWFVAASGGSRLGATFTPTVAADFTLYAHWTLNSYTVAYNTQGGTTVASASWSWGDSITLPSAPTRSGYDFAGWFTASSGGSSLGASHTPGTPANLTLYAHWTPKSYTVSFDSQGGSTVASANFNFGDPISMPSAPTRAGFTFTGWFVAPSGGSSVGSSHTPTAPGDLTLYAHWTAVPYTVFYDTKGGSTVASSTFAFGDTVALPIAPTKNGYDFAGWYVVSSGGSALGLTFTPTTAADVTLYAQWTPASFPVTFNAQGGSSVPSSSYTWGGSVTMPPAPTRPGYNFTGWYVAGTGGTALGSSVTPTAPGALTIYAQWSPMSFRLIYKPNGGSGTIANQSYTVAGSALVLADGADYSRAGYDFVGWNTTAAGDGTDYSSREHITLSEDMTLYAVWKLAPATVTPTPTPSPSTTPARPEPSPSPEPTGKPLATPTTAPSAPTVETVDLGNGATTQTTGLTPLRAVMTNDTATRSVNEMQNEAVDGFKGGSSVVIKVSGSKTTGQFIVTDSNVIDTVAVAAALQESTARQAADFAKISSVTAVTTVDPSKVTTGLVTTDASDLFKASGLGAPTTLPASITKTAKHWIDIKGSAKGYAPGSVVYLAVTTDPIIFGSATVDANGNAVIDGLLPVDVLEPAAHNVRIVGTRSLGGIRVDANGQIQLTASTMSKIQQFDRGTNAVVQIFGKGANGAHAAFRLIDLTPIVPWWTLWLLIGLLVALFGFRRYKPHAKAIILTYWIVAIGGMVAVEILAWFEMAYVMIAWPPVAALVAIGSDIVASIVRRRRGQQRTSLGNYLVDAARARA
jgi:uncharacterized repeat protein (TIGR02543 family)